MELRDIEIGVAIIRRAIAEIEDVFDRTISERAFDELLDLMPDDDGGDEWPWHPL